MQMADQGNVASTFHHGGSSALTITVDPSRTYQRMDGFGASITDSSASVLYRLDKRTRDATMADLFRDATGCRSCASRWAPRTSSTARTTPTTTSRPARPTTACATSPSRTTSKQILPLLRQALALNPRLKVIASPWSPPAWMKTNQSLVGGRLIDDPRIYDTYARYFVEFVQAYQRAGVPIYARDAAERAAEPLPERLPGHGHAGGAGGEADRGARARSCAPRT